MHLNAPIFGRETGCSSISPGLKVHIQAGYLLRALWCHIVGSITAKNHQRRWLVLLVVWTTGAGGALWRMRRYLETMLWHRLLVPTANSPYFLTGLTVFKLMSGRLISLFVWLVLSGGGVSLSGASVPWSLWGSVDSSPSTWLSPWSSRSPSFSQVSACHCETTTRSCGKCCSNGFGLEEEKRRNQCAYT